MIPLRWSNLRWMAWSPAHYRHHLDFVTPPTPAMRLGAYVHKLVLGGTRKFVVWDGERRGNDWKAFKEQHSSLGAEILTRDESIQGRCIADSVFLNPLAMAALEGVKEQPITWQLAGRDCGGTPDVHGGMTLTELKVCNTAQPERFPGHAVRMGWFGQLGWYAEALRHFTGLKPEQWKIVVVEPKPPFAVTMFSLVPSAMEFGDKSWRLLFERLRACEESNQWPAYAQSEVPLFGPDESEPIFHEEEVEA